MRRPSSLVSLILLGVLVAACGPEVRLGLPTVSDPIPACRGMGFEQPTFLRGDANYDGVLWLEFPNGRRADVRWPSGYSAAIRSGLIVVLDAAGQAVAQAGQTVSGGCVTGDQDVWVLVPPL